MNTLHIKTDGRIVCLWTDDLPLAELGQLKIKRASHVEFNHRTQRWEVRLVGQKRVNYSHSSRHFCLEWERRIINKTL